MTELMRHTAESLKIAIGQQPERAMGLLWDFAKDYGISEDIENEILLCQFEFADTNTEGGNSKEKLKEKLLFLLNEIVEKHDAGKVSDKFQKELAIAEAVRQIPIRNDVVLAADGLTKNYKRSRFTLTTNELELRLGEITGLVGENATGKTTLLNILAGQLAQEKGSLHYPLFDPKDRKDWTDLKLRIAYVPQELTAWEGALTENLTFEAARHGIKGDDNRRAVERIVQRLGLALHTDKDWAALSGGYKLRFALAKALVWQPQLLILDEPLAYLDVKTQAIVLADLRSLAKSLKQPLAILVSSQHLHETEAVADQMWFMRGGTLENLGSTQHFNEKRGYNLFEIAARSSFADIAQALADLDHLKIWQNDTIVCIQTPLSISADALLQHCRAQHLALTYFRDISQSVKTKFYEDSLV